jgi:hypothetical protein
MKINNFIIAQDIIEFPKDCLETIADPNFYKDYDGLAPHKPNYNSGERHMHTDREKELHNKLNAFYTPIIDGFMKDINLYHHSHYKWHWWWNVYPKNSNHCQSHAHMNPTSMFGFSWVHFIQPSTNKSNFLWELADGATIPHKEVKDKIIFFPNWAWHQVLANSSKKTRITVSGIINVSGANSPTSLK